MQDIKQTRDELIGMLTNIDVSNIESKVFEKAASEFKESISSTSTKKEGCWSKSHSKLILSK